MNIVIPKPVNEILNLFIEYDYQAYLVDGTVRDLVMGEKVKKYNIATNAPLMEAQKILKNYDLYFNGENNQILVLNNPKFPMEIVEYNTNTNDIESFLSLQDFTMNALAYSDEDGLIDYSSGVIDIRNEIIKVNGDDEENLVADPLRILRAIRLSGEYKMRIDLQTSEYMFENKELLKEVAPERLRDELSKILEVDKCAFYLKKYFDIFLVIIPELALMENFEQNSPYHIYDVLEHTLVALKNSENSLDLRLAILFHDIAKPLTYVRDKNGNGHFPNHCKKGAEMTREIMNRLKFSKKRIQLITKLVEYHDVEFPEKENLLKQFLAKFDNVEIELLFKLKKADLLAKNPNYKNEMNKIDDEFNRIQAILKSRSFLKKNELKINGKDLIGLGINQENIGKTMDFLYKEVLNGNIKNNKDKLISYVINKILPKGYDE